MHAPNKLIVLAGISLTCLTPSGALLAQEGAQEPMPPIAADKTVEESQDAAFEAFVNQAAVEYLAITPELATLYGIDPALAGPRSAETLSDYSPAGVEDARKATYRLYQSLLGFDRAALKANNRVSFDVIHAELKNAIEVSETVPYGRLTPGMFRIYQLDQFIGAHTMLANLMASAQPASTQAEAEVFLARLRKIPNALQDLSLAVEADAARGVVPPDFALQKIIDSIEIFIAPDPSKNTITAAFASKLGDAHLDSDHALSRRAEAIIGDGIYPAFRALVSKLRDLKKSASHEPGIWRLPNGAALYDHLIRQQANTDLSAEEIHSLGLGDVARISGEMDAILVSQGYHQGTVAERMQMLSVDPRFLYPDTPAGKAEVINVLNGQMRDITAQLDRWFGIKPSHPIEVRMVPPYQEATAASASYDPPAMDGTRPGVYWINLRDMANLPIWSVKSDTFHEVIPGHHLQSSIALGNGDSPLIRNLLFNSPYLEGWALYAEHLAKEMGMYDNDPFGDLGRLRWELHRAVRLVVDTGMHSKHWSREQAISYSAVTTGMDVGSIEQEVERYAVIPGQALSYKIGMLKIQSLRSKAKRALGDKFDIRLFHDAILKNGPMPLDMLERQIDAWIAQQQH